MDALSEAFVSSSGYPDTVVTSLGKGWGTESCSLGSDLMT